MMTGPWRWLRGLAGHGGPEAERASHGQCLARCGGGWSPVGEGRGASGVERNLSVGTPTLEGSIRAGGSFSTLFFFFPFPSLLRFPCAPLPLLSLWRALSHIWSLSMILFLHLYDPLSLLAAQINEHSVASGSACDIHRNDGSQTSAVIHSYADMGEGPVPGNKRPRSRPPTEKANVQIKSQNHMSVPYERQERAWGAQRKY